MPEPYPKTVMLIRELIKVGITDPTEIRSLIIAISLTIKSSIPAQNRQKSRPQRTRSHPSPALCLPLRTQSPHDRSLRRRPGRFQPVSRSRRYRRGFSDPALLAPRRRQFDGSGLPVAPGGRELAPATINRRLAALRSLVKMGRMLGVIVWTLEVPNLKAQAYRDTKGPGRPAVRAMMERCTARGDRKGTRDFALLRILFDLGLRRGEVHSLDLEHVDLEAGTVSILGKGRLQRETLSLPSATIEALRAWISVRGTARKPGPLFTSCDNARKGDGRLSSEGIYKTVRRIGEDIGIRTRPHGLRHTAITEAVKAAQANGYGLEEVTDFSRHASVTTLMIYRDRERNVQGKLAEAVSAGI